MHYTIPHKEWVKFDYPFAFENFHIFFEGQRKHFLICLQSEDCTTKLENYFRKSKKINQSSLRRSGTTVAISLIAFKIKSGRFPRLVPSLGMTMCYFWKFSVLILLCRLFLLLARHSLQAASALASCVGSVFRFNPTAWAFLPCGSEKCKWICFFRSLRIVSSVIFYYLCARNMWNRKLQTKL